MLYLFCVVDVVVNVVIKNLQEHHWFSQRMNWSQTFLLGEITNLCLFSVIPINAVIKHILTLLFKNIPLHCIFGDMFCTAQ